MTKVLAIVLVLFSSVAWGEDLGFRYVDGACRKSDGTRGFNPYYQGECGYWGNADLRRLNLQSRELQGSRFVQSNLSDADFSGADLLGVQFVDVDLTGTRFRKSVLFQTKFLKSNLTRADFEDSDIAESLFENSSMVGSNFNRTTMVSGRFLNSDLSYSAFNYSTIEDSTWESVVAKGVHFVGARLSSSSAVDTDLRDVVFRDARLQRQVILKSNLIGSDFRNATLSLAKTEKVDFSSSDFRATQFERNQNHFAEVQFKESRSNEKTSFPWSDSTSQSLGILPESSDGLFILWDRQNDIFRRFLAGLDERGIQYILPEEPYYEADLKILREKKIDSVLHFASQIYVDMSEENQAHLLSFVQNGGTYISTEYVGAMYEFEEMLQDMVDLVLFRFPPGSSTPIRNRIARFKIEPKYLDHPLFAGIPQSFQTDRTIRANGDPVREFDRYPTEVLLRGDQDNVGLAIRHYHKGKVIAFGITGSSNNQDTLNERHFFQMLVNSILWAR